MDFLFFKSSTTGVGFLIWGLIILVLAILGGAYVSYRLRRYRIFERFLNEMRTLGLTVEQEKTFADLVGRHVEQEPVRVLHSLPMFDKIAQKEIERILSGSIPEKAKARMINTIYEIRHKTYGEQPDGEPEEKPSEMAASRA